MLADSKRLILPRSSYNIAEHRIIDFVPDIIFRPRIQLSIKSFRASYLNDSGQESTMKAAASSLVAINMEQGWQLWDGLSVDDKDRLLDLLLLAPNLRILGLCSKHMSLRVRQIFEVKKDNHIH
jgi:hypothetical protein